MHTRIMLLFQTMPSMRYHNHKALYFDVFYMLLLVKVWLYKVEFPAGLVTTPSRVRTPVERSGDHEFNSTNVKKIVSLFEHTRSL